MKIKKFENNNTENLIPNEIYEYLKRKMEEDLSNGELLIELDEFDDSWLNDELENFLSNNIYTSYTLLEFGNKYSYSLLEKILKTLFPKNFEEVSTMINNYKLSEEYHVLNFSDIKGNLSAKYNINKKNGKFPFKKENRLFVEITKEHFNDTDVVYITREQAKEYNKIQKEIIILQDKLNKII